MAIAYRGATSGEKNNGGDVALDFATNIPTLAENDVVVLAYSTGDNDGVDHTMAITTGSGWTKIVDIHADDTFDTDLGVFWKRMGATVDTGVTVTGNGGTDASTCAIAVAFSGVDTTTAIDVTTTTATGTNSGLPNPPSIDYDTAGSAVVAIGANANNDGTATTFSGASGYTTNFQTRAANDTSDTTLGVGYNLSPSDPEDPGAFTYSTTDDVSFSWCAATVALRPLAGPGTVVKDIIGMGVVPFAR